MNTYESQPSDIPLITADQQVHIYCPDCDYDVTGQTENRCPECGEEFNAERLRSWSTLQNLPPTVGPRREVGYMTLANQSLVQPARLARNLPAHPSVRANFWYATVVKVLASAVIPAILFLMYAAVERRNLSLLQLIHMQGFLLLPALGCELAMAGLLSWSVVPRAVERRNRFRFWYAACSCFSIHFFITSLFMMIFTIASFCISTIKPANPYRFYLDISFAATPILTILWWWHCLGTAISTRGLPSSGRTLCVFLIPFIGFAAIVSGFFIMRLEMIIMRLFGY